MNKLKMIPLALALATAGLLTGCFDNKEEVKTDVKQETTQVALTESKESKEVKTEVATPVETTASQPEVEVKEQKSETPTVDGEKKESSTVAITPQELPADFFAPLVENKDYVKVAVDPSKNLVEASYNKPVIVDFFWYGCGHCNAMRPLMSSIIKTNPDFLSVKYPAAFPNWESGTKLYFAYQSLGLFDKLHDATFDALHVQHRNLLGNTEQLDKFLEEHNVDVKKFHEVQNGFQMSRDLSKARETTAQYKLQSTPNMGVYYKGYAYLVNPSLSKGYENTAKSLKLMLTKFSPEQIKGE